jgi:hypothetical protein
VGRLASGISLLAIDFLKTYGILSKQRMYMMKKKIFLTLLMTVLYSPCLPILDISRGSSVVVQISTYRIELLTKGNKRVTLTITTDSENEARREALSQYPGATILSVTKLR